MVQSFSEDFSVIWKDPEDEKLTWVYDPMHFPRPLAPLAAEFLDRLYTEYMSARTVYVNGFAFTTGLNPPPPTPAILERGIGDVWANDFLPQMKAQVRTMQAGDYDNMSLGDIGDLAEKLMTDTVRGFGFSMLAITGFMGPTFELEDSETVSLRVSSHYCL